MPELSRERATELAWERGLLGYKVYRYQRPLYEALWGAILDPNCLQFTPVISRQFGKSFCQNLVATEFAIRVPRSEIHQSSPSRQQIKTISLPVMSQILADCPERLRPKYRDRDHYWIFPNGSKIHLGGANDGHADDLRGPRSHLGLVDEAGFIDDLDYLVDSIMTPQTLSTNGTTIITSTPPLSPAHPFVDFVNACQARGHYIHRDIYATDYSRERIAALMHAAGGENSSNWKREYLALFVIDQNLAICPEWSQDYVGLPPMNPLGSYWHRYEFMDMGVRDNTAVLFAYYDFKAAQLCIEDEEIIKGTKLVTPLLADLIRKKEVALGYDQTGVYQRVADNTNLQLLNDLRAIHGLPFLPTSKDDLTAMVNELRMWVGAGRVRVHPRCANLIGCAKSAIWKNEANVGREFARSRQFGHFDALAALIYGVRNCHASVNPVPPGLGYNPYLEWRDPKTLEEQSDTAAVLRNFFRIGRR